jgi:hypothetical protein
MPFLLVAAGIIMVAVGANGTQAAFFAQLRGDAVPFTKYMIAIGGVGALGYIRDLRELSHYIMALIIISMVISNQGFFQQFSSAIQAGPESPTKPANTNTSFDISGLVKTSQSAIQSDQSIAQTALQSNTSSSSLGPLTEAAIFALG